MNYIIALKDIMFMAAKSGKSKILKILAGANVDFKIQNEVGDTTLMLAAREGHAEVVHNFIEDKNANLELRNNQGKTALEEAIDNNKLSTTRLLLKNKAIIRNPQRLFDFLQQCDQRDPDLLDSLTILCLHLKDLRKIDEAEQKSFNYKNLLEQAEVYLTKLNNLTFNYLEKVFNAVKQGIEKDIPPEIINSVASTITIYDIPLEDRVRFFKPTEIHKIINSQDSDNSKKISDKLKSQCSIM